MSPPDLLIRPGETMPLWRDRERVMARSHTGTFRGAIRTRRDATTGVVEHSKHRGNLQEMAIYQLGDLIPVIPASCYIAAEATIIGQVTLGERVTVMSGAVIRGD